MIQSYHGIIHSSGVSMNKCLLVFQHTARLLVPASTRGKGSFDVYPNPITGDNSTVLFNNIAKGMYTIKLINSTGQIISNTRINHPGGSASYTFSIDAHLPKGIFTVKITGVGLSFNKQILK